MATKKTFPLAAAFALLEQANAAIEGARHCGEYTDRSDPALQRGQDLIVEAIRAAAAVGWSERDLYRLFNER